MIDLMIFFLFTVLLFANRKHLPAYRYKAQYSPFPNLIVEAYNAPETQKIILIE
jgi:hypothetical protein